MTKAAQVTYISLPPALSGPAGSHDTSGGVGAIGAGAAVEGIVRAAVDAWLEKASPGMPSQGIVTPLFYAGRIKVGPRELRDAAHSDRTGSAGASSAPSFSRLRV